MIIQTKYNEDDLLWFMQDNKPMSRKPMGFKVDCTYHGNSGRWGSGAFPIIISYLMDNKSGHTPDWINEIFLFKTKEELLASL